MIAFIQALGFDKVDLFGYSMGGRAGMLQPCLLHATSTDTFAVQTVAITQPSLVRKMIIAGGSPVQPIPTSPKDTRDTKYMMAMATAVTYEESHEAFKHALFGESPEGSSLFESYWKRLQDRTVEPPNLEPVPLDKGGNSQIAAVVNADKPENVKFPDRLAALRMPVLVANGSNDLTLGLVRTLDLHQRLQNSQLVIYPNSGHGFLWQYAELFAEQVNLFLDSSAFDEELR